MAAGVNPLVAAGAIGAVLGLGVWLLSGGAGSLGLGGPAAHTTLEGKMRFWEVSDTAQTEALRKLLAASHITAQPGVPGAWLVTSGATGGAGNALAHVKALQAKGSLVNASTNLLDAGASPRMLAEIPPTEWANFASKEGTAILPPM